MAAAQSKLAKASDTGEYQAPCDAGKPNYRSDLCAQWHAANAARDAADAAWWSLWIGGIGAVGLIVALLLTIDSNRIARDTAKRQLRAYVSMTDFKCQIGIQPSFSIVVNNVGTTPAYSAVLNYKFWFSGDGAGRWSEFQKIEHVGPLAPQSHLRVGDEGQIGDMLEDAMHLYRVGELKAWIEIRVDYLDAFDAPRHTKMRANIQWCRRGPLIEEVHTVDPDGTEAT